MALEYGSYLTDGVNLFCVLGHNELSIYLEDAKTNAVEEVPIAKFAGMNLRRVGDLHNGGPHR